MHKHRVSPLAADCALAFTNASTISENGVRGSGEEAHDLEVPCDVAACSMLQL
jgi:hypothetical protein